MRAYTGAALAAQYPHQIISKPRQFVHLIESDMNWRVVHADGRRHKPPEELGPL